MTEIYSPDYFINVIIMPSITLMPNLEPHGSEVTSLNLTALRFESITLTKRIQKFTSMQCANSNEQ